MAGRASIPPSGVRPPGSKSAHPRGNDVVTDLVPPLLGRRQLVVVAALAGVALLGVVFWVLLRRPSPSASETRSIAPPPELVPEEAHRPAPPAVRNIDVTTIPAEAGISIDNGSPWTGQIHTTIPADGETHVIRVWAQGYEPKTISFGPGERPPTQIHLDPLGNPTAGGKAPKIGIPHKSGRSRPAAVPPSGEEPKSPKRGVNDAFIIE